MVKYCENCGKANIDEAKLCVSCGNDFKNESLKTENFDGNNENNEDKIIVPNTQSSQYSGNTQNSSTSKNKTIIIGIVGIIGIILVAIIGFYGIGAFLNENNNNDNNIISTFNDEQISNSLPGGNVFNDGYVSFNYPSTWSIYTPANNTDKLVSLKTSKGSTSILGVFMQPAGSTSIEKYKKYNQPTGNETLISSKDITINGVKGFDVSLKYYDNGGGEQRIIGFIKDGYYYKMIFTTGSLKVIDSDMNQIINSFTAL